MWVVGDDAECIVVDAPHSVDDILAVVGDRKVKAMVSPTRTTTTSGCAGAARGHGRGAPILLHPDDRPLSELTHADYLWDIDLGDDQIIQVAGDDVPGAAHAGHAPGAVCLLPSLRRLRVHQRHTVRGWPRERRVARTATTT